MTPRALELYLHRHIPLSKAMEASVVARDDGGIELSAPLPPNLNHRGTAFGGSVSSLAVLSAWTLLHVELGAAQLPSRIVIQKSEFTYLKPIDGEFRAVCLRPAPAVWNRFLTTLRRRGKARIALTASVFYGEVEAGLFTGDYVALGGADGDGGGGSSSLDTTASSSR